MGIAKTRAEKAFDAVNIVFVGAVSMAMLFPLAYALAGSFSSTGLIGGFRRFSVDAYRYIGSTGALLKATFNSIVITIVGTLVNMLFTIPAAYALSRRQLAGRSIFMRIVVFFMLFSPGLIPLFLVVDKAGLMNSYAALWLPNAISAFNMIVAKNFFQTIDRSLEESAKMDGGNDLQIFVRIMLPLSKASLATIGLMYAVAHWNGYFSALIYLRDQGKWPIQVWLRQIVILSAGGFAQNENLSEFASVPSEAVKFAVIIVSTIPIVLVYPFLQKHFTKGVMMGSIKG
jgi:putative aldouronate transport system permease protein